MPSDTAAQHESDRDRDRDRERGGDSERGDRGGSKQKASAASKSKDLSHVPCKFYKVGGCTAGASCPFSHSAAEPGNQKEPCTWFVKGNCKFGHKCALAHILPGQSMAMDRKNKKAAQTSAPGAEKGRTGGRGGKREATGSNGGGTRLPLLAGGATAPTRILNTGDSSSSPSGRPPMNMSLKATISPSAPAPPLKDTDFASFATFDEMEGVQHPPASSEPAEGSAVDTPFTTQDSSAEAPKPIPKTNPSAAPVPLPPSAPRPSTNSNVHDFGPIGSPPNFRSGQATSPNRANGSTFSPGTSPLNRSHLSNANISGSPSGNNVGMLSSSPFSAPGTQTQFMTSSYSTGGGIAASLGSGLAMMGGRRARGDPHESGANAGPNSYSGLLSAQLSSSASQHRSGSMNGYDISIEYDDFSGVRHGMARGAESAVEEEDLEDFLPSSLNDLLTPEERSRRMSRSNSGQPTGGVSHLANAMASATIGTDSGSSQAAGNGTSGLGHRYSRSVPAPTLLGDIKSIWADTSAHPMPSSPPTHRGTPSAYSSRLDSFAASGGHADDIGLSMSMGSAGTASSLGMMSPSNASAAFLPGLHHHYLSAKAKQAQQAQLGHPAGLARGMRGTSNPLFPSTGASGLNNNALANNYLQPLGVGNMGMPSSVNNSSGVHTHTHGGTQTTYRTTPSPFDLTQNLHHQLQQQPHTARPIPSNVGNHNHGQMDDPMLAPHLLSPGARALQSHAPGQSLPQGLAAGYSRIHALPPLTNMASPPTSGSFIPGTSPAAAAAYASNNFNYNPGNTEAPYGGDWASHNNVNQKQGVSLSGQSNPGIDQMVTRISYSTVTAPNRSGLAMSSAQVAAANNPPPGLSRNVSGGKYNQTVGPLSPLGGPVVTRDDDDLFDMDR